MAKPDPHANNALANAVTSKTGPTNKQMRCINNPHHTLRHGCHPVIMQQPFRRSKKGMLSRTLYLLLVPRNSTKKQTIDRARDWEGLKESRAAGWPCAAPPPSQWHAPSPCPSRPHPPPSRAPRLCLGRCNAVARAFTSDIRQRSYRILTHNGLACVKDPFPSGGPGSACFTVQASPLQTSCQPRPGTSNADAGPRSGHEADSLCQQGVAAAQGGFACAT